MTHASPEKESADSSDSLVDQERGLSPENGPAENSPVAPPNPEFVQTFTRYQRRLFLFILSQVGNPIDAEELLQQTNLVIWRKAYQFQPGTNFLAWACRIAGYEVLRYRTQRRREKERVLFSDELLAELAEEAVDRAEEFESRRRALVQCLKKLRPADRELIQHRYAPGQSGKDLAELLGRPANSVYQSLGRIRRMLWECVQRTVTAEAFG